MKRCRLIYKSVLCPDLLAPEDLPGMVEKAAVNNDKAGITGVLVFSGGRFLQVLEGPVKFVNQLYGRIVSDERHRDVELISYELVPSTYFPDWSMKLLRLDDSLPAAVRATLAQKYSEQDGHIAIPDDLLHVYALLLDVRWGLLDAGQKS